MENPDRRKASPVRLPMCKLQVLQLCLHTDEIWTVAFEANFDTGGTVNT